MFCSSLSIYYLIILATLMSIYDLVVAKEAPSYLDRYCDNAKPRDDTNQTLFQENLNATLHELSTRSSSIDNGFYNTSYGLGSADTVYGLFLCRGDLSWDSCQQCIHESIYESQKQCGDSVRGAIIWFNVCMLRYSDQNIFSKLEVNKKIWNNSSDNATDPGQFSATLSDLISELIEKVVSSSHFYASQALKATDSETIYGLMQCTQDLTPSDCKKCLIRNAIELPNHCDGKTGGEFLTPNCNFRFETSVFYTDIGHASPPPPPPNSKKFGTIGTIIGIAVAMVVLAILLLISWICILRKKAQKKYQFGKGKGGKASYDDRISIEQSLQFDLATIRAATNKFSPDNKIGEGGFGSVYKGTLPNGQEIAVKRLFKSPRQVVNEFKNEVEVVARLQHRNLVRLLGFCLDGEEKLLIYEFVPRKSLDYFLFDPTKRAQLDWPTSYQIIKGVAGGLLYLHEDSRLKIIHRDLKCGNILLDDDMNPKIADFGNARIFKNDQHGGSTSRVVGTYGYMSPEYAMLGQYSVKSDVFSFGILTLEIISGKRSTCFTQSSSGDDLVSCVSTIPQSLERISSIYVHI